MGKQTVKSSEKFKWPILSDQYTLDDQLGYADYCHVLKMAVQQAGTPITIGVLGDWGSGKTSLMKMLEADLNKDGGNCITIWFDAWKFAKEEVLWRAFLLRVITDLRQALIKAKKLDKDREKQFDEWERRMYESLDLEQLGDLTFNWKKAASAGVAAISSNIPFGSVLSRVVDKLTGEESASKAAKDLVEGDLHSIKEFVDLVGREKTEIHKRQLEFMEEFNTQFETIIAECVTADSESRLVIFIDDLDRCLPEKAIQILEAIKLFLEVKGTVFVLGVAPEVIQRGIEVWYKMDPAKQGQEMPFTGKKYLEKIIQLPFRLPAIEQEAFARFIEENCKNMPEYCSSIFARGLEANPRGVKRLLNVFGLQLALGQRRFSKGNRELEPALLAKLNVIQERWPRLYQHLVSYPAEIKELEQACLEEKERHPEGPVPARPIEGGTDDKTARPKTYSDVISEHARFVSLQEMMLFEQEKCGVQNLDFSVLKNHIHLTRTTTSTVEKQAENLEGLDIWRQLTSKSKEEQNEGLERIRELEGEPDRADWSNRLNGQVRQERFKTLPHASRSAVLKALSLVGDDRPEVLDSARMAFSKIAGGDFWLGEGEEVYECKELDYDYRLSTYPVTVSQFKQFSDAGGYEQERYWPEAAQAESWKEGKVKFYRDDDWRPAMPALSNRFNYMNHPMVMISWFESLAYCRWLTEQFRQGDVIGKDLEGLNRQSWQVTLPSEAEWEKAARGSKEKSLYPFGDEIAPNLANYDQTAIESTSAVGCFPGGASPYGCLDMSGNIWEWCRNTFEKYPYKRDDREDVTKNVGSTRVFRGGSWGNPAEDCRCSCRYGINPGFGGVGLGFRVVLVPSSLSPAG